jgi:hypothetical protein
MGLSNHRPHRRAGRPRRQPTGSSGPRFVIQHYPARANHYDFRLEIDGVLVSWAIPRGPAVNPKEQRMARRTDDRPLDEVGPPVVWDHGTYANRTAHEMTTCLGRGHLSFLLNGEKLRGGYALTRVREGEEETWLLVKRRDDMGNELNGWR